MENLTSNKIIEKVENELSAISLGRGRPGKIAVEEQLKVYRLRSKELLDEKSKILPATAPI